MFTIIKHNNDIIKINTQAYWLDTYVCIHINNKLACQYGVSMKEDKYHKRIRTKAIKNNHILISGTVLKSKSKYKINEFIENIN